MRSLVAMVTAGCAAGPQPLANRAAHPERHECTERVVERLTTALRARWRVARLELRCAAGRFGGVDGLFLEARSRGLFRIGVVDASGAELVAFVDQPEPDPATFINGYQAADLDGDDNDEIVESWRRSSPVHLEADNWLVIRRIANARFLPPIRGPYVSRYHPDLGGCSASWELRAGSLVVAVDVKPGIPPTDCLPEGTHRFALRGRQLIERAR